MNKTKFVIWSIPLLLITIIGLWHYGTVDAAQPSTPAAINAQQIQWEGDPVQVTTDSTEKEGPVMSVSPDGEELLIAYNIIRSGTVDKFDVLYAKSVDQGASWITATIHSEAGAGVSSSQVDLAYDASGTAHAVWIFGNKIAYARESEWASNTPTILYDPGSLVLLPSIVTSGDETVDVVWNASITSDLKHVRSVDGGDTWGLVDTVSSTSAFKPSPDMIEYNGKLHVVWEDVNETNLVSGTIKYVQADMSVSPVAWSAPVAISGDALPNLHDAREASITVNKNVLQVSYTHRQSKQAQWIYIATCDLSSDCTQSANWTLNTSPISGAVLGVNAQAPWNMFSNLISYNGCTYAHFHGTTAVYTEDNELIWSSNSCNNWAPRRELTNPQVQALFPSATVRGSRVYMAYGQNPVLNDPVHQIFFKRSAAVGPETYLPLIMR